MTTQNNVDWSCSCGRTYLNVNGFVAVVDGDNKCRDSDLTEKFQSEWWTDDMIKYVASKTPKVKHELESMMPTMEQPDIVKAAYVISRAITAAFDSLAMAVFLGLIIGLFMNGCIQ